MNQANPDPGAAMDLGKKSAEDAPDTAAQDMGYWSGMLFQVIVNKRNLLPVKTHKCSCCFYQCNFP